MTEQTYLSILKLRRPQAASQPTPAEEAIFERHFRYLQHHRDSGTVLLAGPCTDGAFGIVILRAPSAAEAEVLMRQDPAIAEGLMHGEIHPFRVSLMGAF